MLQVSLQISIKVWENQFDKIVRTMNTFITNSAEVVEKTTKVSTKALLLEIIGFAVACIVPTCTILFVNIFFRAFVF